jgi:hypothetical protein
MSSTTVAATDTERRLIEFAAEVNRLADQRIDLELRELVDELHRDLGGGGDDDG